MSQKLTDDIHYKNIATAIRDKLGTTFEEDPLKPSMMASRIRAIRTGITPTGYETFTENAEGINVTNLATININVSAASIVSGKRKTVTVTGSTTDVNVTDYEFIDINVRNTAVTQHLDIIRNERNIDVSNCATVTVAVPAEAVCEDTDPVTVLSTNGTHTVTGLKHVVVNVPTQIGASGTVEINEQYPAGRELNVENFKYARVVLTPDKVIDPDSVSDTITANGRYDVTAVATAVVDVPASAVCTGSKTIQSNADGIPVTGYAYVNVQVPSTITLNEDPLKFTNNTTEPVDVADRHYVEVAVTAEALATGSMDIDEVGVKNVVGLREVNVTFNPDKMLPADNLDVAVNGTYNVKNYKQVSVNVPQVNAPEGNLDINNNGVFNVVDKSTVTVDVPASVTDVDEIPPITRNTADGEKLSVVGVKEIEVKVPPSEAVDPTSYTEIDETNGTIVDGVLNKEVDVTDKATAKLKIDIKNCCQGTKTITESGPANVAGYENVNVVISGSSEPGSTIGMLINANGSVILSALGGASISINA